MSMDDPYFDLKKTLKGLIRAGNKSKIVMYRSDCPGYSETISTLIQVNKRGTILPSLVPYEWKTELCFFSIPDDTDHSLLKGRVTVFFDREVAGDINLIKKHRDLIDAGVKAPIYLRGKPVVDSAGGMLGRYGVYTDIAFHGVSVRNDADATMVAALSDIMKNESR